MMKNIKELTEKYGWKIIFRFKKWKKGEVWNWFILPSLEFSPWQKSVLVSMMGGKYYSAWVCIQFLKMELCIGLRRLQKDIV